MAEFRAILRAEREITIVRARREREGQTAGARGREEEINATVCRGRRGTRRVSVSFRRCLSARDTGQPEKSTRHAFHRVSSILIKGCRRVERERDRETDKEKTELNEPPEGENRGKKRKREREREREKRAESRLREIQYSLDR